MSVIGVVASLIFGESDEHFIQLSGTAEVVEICFPKAPGAWNSDSESHEAIEAATTIKIPRDQFVAAMVGYCAQLNSIQQPATALPQRRRFSLCDTNDDR